VCRAHKASRGDDRRLPLEQYCHHPIGPGDAAIVKVVKLDAVLAGRRPIERPEDVLDVRVVDIAGRVGVDVELATARGESIAVKDLFP